MFKKKKKKLQTNNVEIEVRDSELETTIEFEKASDRLIDYLIKEVVSYTRQTHQNIVNYIEYCRKIKKNPERMDYYFHNPVVSFI